MIQGRRRGAISLDVVPGRRGTQSIRRRPKEALAVTGLDEASLGLGARVQLVVRRRTKMSRGAVVMRRTHERGGGVVEAVAELVMVLGGGAVVQRAEPAAGLMSDPERRRRRPRVVRVNVHHLDDRPSVRPSLWQPRRISTTHLS